MPAARIIACLDVADGVVVKGVRFRDHRIVGDIVECAARYRDEGADELVFYDITASADRRQVDLAWVERVARVIDIPFCVAGGIADVATARGVLAAGADKVSVNSPALQRPSLITELADAFGRQCVVVGIDSLANADGHWTVKQFTGRLDATSDSGRETVAWAREATDLGAGEIVLNCMAKDGVRTGYDLDQLRAVVAVTDVPVVISGGAGAPVHFVEAFREGASGALAASILHDRQVAIAGIKAELITQGFEVRP